MLEFANFPLFVSASILLILAPGPDILFVITQGITQGRRAGFFTAIGLAIGNAVHTLAAALGVSVLFRQSPLAFNTLKAAGAAYLLFLAFKAVTNRDDVLEIGASLSKPVWALMLRGFLMNVLNPKVAIFFLAFLPQFISGDSANSVFQILLFGSVFIVLVALIFGSIGLSAGVFGRILSRSIKIQRILNWAAAGIFIALGVKLLMTHL